jgi:monoamine oxidase
VQGFDAAHLDRISAHSLRRAEYASEHMDGSWQGRVGEGYSALIRFFAEDIMSHGGMIATGENATQINWKDNRVEVVVEKGRRLKTYRANTAVIALPLGILKKGRLRFHPALPKKEEAIQGLEMGNVLKVSIVFRDRWWPTTGFIQAFKEPFPTIWDDSRGPVLTAWAGGPKADALRGFSPAKLAKTALEVIARVFSANLSAIKRRVLASYSHDWRNDPYIRGAYSYIPVNGMDLPKVLAEPVRETLFLREKPR